MTSNEMRQWGLFAKIPFTASLRRNRRQPRALVLDSPPAMRYQGGVDAGRVFFCGPGRRLASESPVEIGHGSNRESIWRKAHQTHALSNSEH
jgi:hypothetical protein